MIIRNKSPWEQSQFGLGVIRMKLKERTFRATAIPCVLITALCSSSARAQEQPAAKELPRPSEITGIKPEVLTRTVVPGAPGKLAIVTRVTYDPGPASGSTIIRARLSFTSSTEQWWCNMKTGAG
jgi:hypothetical protein